MFEFLFDNMKTIVPIVLPGFIALMEDKSRFSEEKKIVD